MTSHATTATVDERESAEYLDPAQAARYMNVSERYLQELCLKGDGPRRIALSRKCHRYRRIDIDAWMTARAHG